MRMLETGGTMVPLSVTLGRILRDTEQGDVLASKAARANKVKQMWRAVVEICCRPHAQTFLDHTNAVYIIHEHDYSVLIVYVDDSIFAAEINARREMIKLKILERFGEEIRDFRILISRGEYKKKHPYLDSTEMGLSVNPPRKPLVPEQVEIIKKNASKIENGRVREKLVKAMISDLERKSDIKVQKGYDRHA